MHIKSNRGFTLVEIAIVLVIIGLLLGGVLKGQELITSARVRNLADQSAGIQAAYYGFVDRFRQVPGDWPANLAGQAIPGVANGGNGNGRLDRARTEWTESLALWEQLSRAGFIQGPYAGEMRRLVPAPAMPHPATRSTDICCSPVTVIISTPMRSRPSA